MTRTKYSSVAILLHWTIALLVIANILIGFGLLGGMPVHKAIGITVLALTVLRIVWRLTHPAPPLPATVPGWQVAASRVSHFLLYAFMLAMPLSGWLFVSNAKELRPLTWFGLFDIPYLSVGSAVYAPMHTAHEVMAFGFVALIALHIAGALKHHLIDRDSVLGRMAPIFSR